jgi:hypothetical protein
LTDSASGELVQPGNVVHSVGSLAMFAFRTGFEPVEIGEFSPPLTRGRFPARAARRARP